MPRRWTAVSIFILPCVFCAGIHAQEGSSDADTAQAPLRVWLPAPLISDESGDAFQLLSEHTAAFSSGNNIDY